MVQPDVEYRYSTAAVGRARLMLAAGVITLLVLALVLISGWQELSLLTRVVGIGFTVLMLTTIRTQLGRIGFRLLLRPDRLEITAPLGGRRIAWHEIAEVRRMEIPRIVGPATWACAVLARDGRAAPRPIYLFDNALERAEQAYRDIVQRSDAAKQHQSDQQ